MQQRVKSSCLGHRSRWHQITGYSYPGYAFVVETLTKTYSDSAYFPLKCVRAGGGVWQALRYIRHYNYPVTALTK